MCAELGDELAGAAVGALPRIAEIDIRLVAARPVLGDDHLHELALVDRAYASLVADHGGVVRARPGRVDAHRNEVHRADRTFSRLVFEHLGVRRHGTDVGHRRQILLSRVSVPWRLWQTSTQNGRHDQNRQSHALQMHAGHFTEDRCDVAGYRRSSRYDARGPVHDPGKLQVGADEPTATRPSPCGMGSQEKPAKALRTGAGFR